MTNKVVGEKLICANFMVEKLRFFLKKSLIRKVVGTRLILNFSYTSYYKTCGLIV